MVAFGFTVMTGTPTVTADVTAKEAAKTDSVATTACAIGSEYGAHIRLDKLLVLAERAASAYPAPANSQKLLYRVDSVLFGEAPARIIVSINAKQKREFERLWLDLDCIEIGVVTQERRLVIDQTNQTGAKTAEAPASVLVDVHVEDLERAWTTRLPFD